MRTERREVMGEGEGGLIQMKGTWKSHMETSYFVSQLKKKEIQEGVDFMAELMLHLN